nr:MAG TPA: hypothetical protein [Caudoviricetes sp.]
MRDLSGFFFSPIHICYLLRFVYLYLMSIV